MDQKIGQDESPESRPNLRCDDGTLFIYSRDRGVYEPYKHSEEERDSYANPNSKNSGIFFAKFWRKHWAFTVTTAISLLTLIVVALYTYYARQQVCATGKAVEEARKSVVTAARSMNLDERAWVSVYDVRLGPPGPRPSVSVSIENKGRTPAKGFFVIAGAGFSANSEENRLPGSGIIAPGGTFHSDVVSSVPRAKQNDLFIHGTIRYTSAFGNEHWTKFCYQQVPNTAHFESCEAGNNIDSNEP